MPAAAPSTAIDDYLKTIYHHTEWQNDPMTPSQLAATLGLAPSTVTEMVQKLAAADLVSHRPYGPVSLTDAGRLRAAAIIAQIDPIAQGYLVKDGSGNYRLPPLYALGGVNLNTSGQTNLLVEYQIHNLSDADFINSIPAVTEVQVLLQNIAPNFGYNPSDTATYNNNFRNVVLSYLSPERLMMIYAKQGLSAVTSEVQNLRHLHLI